LYFIFLTGLIFSSFVAISTNRWFQLWAALEINMLLFTPLIFNKNNLSINSIIKYFIVQSFASSIFILTLIFSQKYLIPIFFNTLTLFALTTKLGLFPIYFWFPQVSEGLSWLSFLILSTWQKLIPLYIISIRRKIFINIVLIISAFIGCVGMLNQTSLRKLFAYSSITHISWILLNQLNNYFNWFLYFIIYSCIILTISYSIINKNLSSIHSLKILKTKINILAFFISLMSLGGLPPFLGFLPKWAIIIRTIKDTIFCLFILIISSLIRVFIYLRLIFPIIFNCAYYSPLTNSPSKFFISLFLNSFLLIPLIPFLFF